MNNDDQWDEQEIYSYKLQMAAVIPDLLPTACTRNLI